MSAGDAVLVAGVLGGGVSLVLVLVEFRAGSGSGELFVVRLVGVAGMLGYPCVRNGFWLG